MNIKIIDWIKSAISKADNAQATVDALAAKVAELHPTGTVFAFAANSAPTGCLLCNGAAVSRTTYRTLFEKIGTLYGEGDGSTTFNLPNLTDKFIQGSGTAGKGKSAGLPNIEGYAYMNGMDSAEITAKGALYNKQSYTGAGRGHQSDQTMPVMGFMASKSNTIYGASTTVQPPALTMRYYIKY